MAKRKAKAKLQEASSAPVEFKTIQESYKERVTEVSELRHLKEAQVKMKEREIELKEWEILLKDKSEMTEG
ncbi:hypothetical protein SESBI_13563 [Sesbania bispinosa]|nr:hypothetical protein SESBI_13563 [Sesbania bispinosa]